MKTSVVKSLAEKYSRAELEEAIAVFETTRRNVFEVEGDDDGEKLSHLLVAAFVRDRMDMGRSFSEGLRDYSQRVRSFVSKAG